MKANGFEVTVCTTNGKPLRELTDKNGDVVVVATPGQPFHVVIRQCRTSGNLWSPHSYKVNLTVDGQPVGFAQILDAPFSVFNRAVFKGFYTKKGVLQTFVFMPLEFSPDSSSSGCHRHLQPGLISVVIYRVEKDGRRNKDDVPCPANVVADSTALPAEKGKGTSDLSLRTTAGCPKKQWIWFWSSFKWKKVGPAVARLQLHYTSEAALKANGTLSNDHKAEQWQQQNTKENEQQQLQQLGSKSSFSAALLSEVLGKPSDTGHCCINPLHQPLLPAP